MKYVIQKENRPVYLQLYKLIRNDIINQVYPYNSRLPSKRMLAEELGISTITIEHAYGLLCDEGYAEARERSGYFVIFQPSDGFAASTAEPVSLAHEKLDTSSYPTFSISILSKTMRKVLTDYGETILEKSPNAGGIQLRSAIRQYLARNRGIQVEIGQIVIGSGFKLQFLFVYFII